MCIRDRRRGADTAGEGPGAVHDAARWRRYTPSWVSAASPLQRLCQRPAGVSSSNCNTHTQSFNGLFSRAAPVGQYQQDKPFWIFISRDDRMAVASAGLMQVICTSLLTDNYASTSSLKFFYERDALPVLEKGPLNECCCSCCCTIVIITLALQLFSGWTKLSQLLT